MEGTIALPVVLFLLSIRLVLSLLYQATAKAVTTKAHASPPPPFVACPFLLTSSLPTSLFLPSNVASNSAVPFSSQPSVLRPLCTPSILLRSASPLHTIRSASSCTPSVLHPLAHHPFCACTPSNLLCSSCTPSVLLLLYTIRSDLFCSCTPSVLRAPPAFFLYRSFCC